MNQRKPPEIVDELLRSIRQLRQDGRDVDVERIVGEHPDVPPDARSFVGEWIIGLLSSSDAKPSDCRHPVDIDDAFDQDLESLHRSKAEQVLPPSELPNSNPELNSTDAMREAVTYRPAQSAVLAPKEHASDYRFGDYDILQEVARGGMGVVYKARHVQLNRIVALKMILAGELAGPEDVRRFQTEARAAAGLDHPNIVPVYEVGEHVGQHYFTMGFIEGDDLSDYARREKLSPQRIASLVQQIAIAVQYAHSKGVIHRDLKPSNVLIDRSGVPRITDFGLAKKLDDQSDLTRSGEVLGTPGYMAPEQAAGHGGRVSAAADIYALGAILYFCLTRRPPFLASSPVETLVLILESEPVPPRKLNPAVPRSLERICLRCLAREPDDRYATAQEVAEDLDRFLQGQPILAEAPSLVDRVRSFSRRFPVFTVHLAAIGFALLISQIRFATVSERVLSDHLRVTGLLLGWLVFCGVVQVASRFAKREFWAETVWLCSDAVVFSSLLYLLTTSTNDPVMLMIGFPMLIVASGLFFRVRIVLIVTAVVVLSFVGYQLATAHLPRFLHYQVSFGVILVIIGACVMHQIRRVRLLTQYFENKRT